MSIQWDRRLDGLAVLVVGEEDDTYIQEVRNVNSKRYPLRHTTECNKSSY